ncbi:MAG: DUF4136 domain-containing protein [Filimonas sp.]|nr:DUF4136 domain-containing protein [Filimonas sp.]
MKLHLSFCMLAAITVLASCGPTLKVTSDYDKNAKFSQYKTFSVNEIDPQKSSVSQLNRDRLVNAVKSELTKKGLQESTSSPDLLVNISTILKDKKSISSNTDYYGYGGYYRPYAWGGGMGVTGYTTYNVQDYKDGSLIIDVADASTKKLIWEGIGNAEIDKPVSKPDEVIPQAVTKIMASYPGGVAKK